MTRYILRLAPNIAWSEHTIEAAKSAGFRTTKKDYFNKPDDYVVVNHGSSAGLAFGPNVTKATVLNSPSRVGLSTHKDRMYSRLQEEEVPVLDWTLVSQQPETNLDVIDSFGLPFVVKPIVGHQGNGVVIVSKASQLLQMSPELLTGEKIIQKYFPKEKEYRFNYINGQLVNVSRKLLPTEADQYPGIFDGWYSLGQATSLHKRAHKLAKKAAAAFPELPSIAVDLMRRDVGDEPEYVVCEVNTGYGLGEMTAARVFASVKAQYEAGQLAAYEMQTS